MLRALLAGAEHLLCRFRRLAASDDNIGSVPLLTGDRAIFLIGILALELPAGVSLRCARKVILRQNAVE